MLERSGRKKTHVAKLKRYGGVEEKEASMCPAPDKVCD